MGLTTRKQQSLVAQDAPHVWEVKIPSHPNGVTQMHCGSLKDATRLLEIYPDATMTKIYLPRTPDTVNVVAQDMGHEKALNEGAKQLPESQAIELEL